MDRLKAIREEKKIPVAILLDTKGPEIRTGLLEAGRKVSLEEGDTLVLTTEEIVGNAQKVSISYRELPSDLKEAPRSSDNSPSAP